MIESRLYVTRRYAPNLYQAGGLRRGLGALDRAGSLTLPSRRSSVRNRGRPDGRRRSGGVWTLGLLRFSTGGQPIMIPNPCLRSARTRWLVILLAAGLLAAPSALSA